MPDDPLGQQKALREFDIGARRAHRDGKWCAVDADLQRLLDGPRLPPSHLIICAEVLGPTASCYAVHLDRLSVAAVIGARISIVLNNRLPRRIYCVAA